MNELKLFIKPTRDTHNSYPDDVEFTSTESGLVTISLDDREVTFSLSDLEKVVRISNAIVKE